MVGEFHDDPGLTVRRAAAHDAAAITNVHIASWRGAYAGVIPDDVLAALDPAAREARWLDILNSSETSTWVAIANQRIIGFASVGPARDEDSDEGDLELYSMYLNPESWGRGVARELMRTIDSEVEQKTPLSLWVLADNERARRFYQRFGFTHDGIERIDEYGGKPLTAVRYVRLAK